MKAQGRPSGSGRLPLLDQRSRVATSSRAKGRLPSPAPQSIDTPTLTEITFRPHSAHCYSFTATIRDSCDGRGVSLGQVVRLIASIGHVGKIDDFTIKPVEQHSYLFPWRPLGLENVGGDWRDCQDQGKWQEQYKLLDSRYKYLHHRETVTERCEKQREAYHKRRKRLPMLSKRRRKRGRV